MFDTLLRKEGECVIQAGTRLHRDIDQLDESKCQSDKHDMLNEIKPTTFELWR